MLALKSEAHRRKSLLLQRVDIHSVVLTENLGRDQQNNVKASLVETVSWLLLCVKQSFNNDKD